VGEAGSEYLSSLLASATEHGLKTALSIRDATLHDHGNSEVAKNSNSVTAIIYHAPE